MKRLSVAVIVLLLGVIIGGWWVWTHGTPQAIKPGAVTTALPEPTAEAGPVPTPDEVYFQPVAPQAGELMPFIKKDLEGIAILNKPYPTGVDTSVWHKGDTFWVEGQLFIDEDTKRIRWSGDFAKPDASRNGLYSTEHQMMLQFAPEDTLIGTYLPYSIIKVRITLDRDQTWKGKVQEWTAITSLEQTKQALVKASEVQGALDELVYRQYKDYLKLKAPYYHFTGKKPNAFQKQECDTYPCLNGIDMQFNTFWDTDSSRMLVYYRWDEDTSGRKDCDYDYNSVAGVEVIDPFKPRVESVYLFQSPQHESCPQPQSQGGQ